MSLNYFVYIGPYAEWTVELIEKAVDNCRLPAACADPKATSDDLNSRVLGLHRSSYCIACGIQHSQRFASLPVEQPAVNWSSLNIDHKLTRADCNCGPEQFTDDKGRRFAYHRYIRNNRGGPGVTLYPKEVDVCAVPVTHDTIMKETCEFIVAYKPELDKLTIAYGGKLPVIKWGVVLWAS